MRPFDVYRGEQVGAGRKSIAFAVTFQSAERTLSDEDAAALRGRIVEGALEAVRRRAARRVNPIRAILRTDRAMGMFRVALAAGAVLAVLGSAGGAGAQSQTLTGVVGPGFTIRLNDSTGAPVKQLDPGTYTIQVRGPVRPSTTST